MRRRTLDALVNLRGGATPVAPCEAAILRTS